MPGGGTGLLQGCTGPGRQKLEELKRTENHPAPGEEHVKGSGYFSGTGK